jgi:hypothetical protein
MGEMMMSRVIHLLHLLLVLQPLHILRVLQTRLSDVQPLLKQEEIGLHHHNPFIALVLGVSLRLFPSLTPLLWLRDVQLGLRDLGMNG